MTPKPKILPPIHPNRGLALRYARALESLTREMAKSVQWWVTAKYRDCPPRMADAIEQAQDGAPPAQRMKAMMQKLGTRWIDRFNAAAHALAKFHLQAMFRGTDSAFQAALRDAGWAVKFQMTPTVNDAFQASLAENVGLIKTIPQEYLSQVEGIVMRGYAAGRDIMTMVEELKALYPKNAERARLIATDQCNKANSVVNQARQLELGITEAIWMHSHAGREPRPDHVAADGKKFKVAEGMKFPGQTQGIQPGWLINCRCTSRSILPYMTDDG